MSTLLSPKQAEAIKPTLNEFLSKQGVSDDICTKLNEQDIGWNELIWLEKEDLDVLCGKNGLNLEFKDKLKFKTAVKTLQCIYKLREKSFIAITMNEQRNLDQINIELRNAQNIQTLFENHFISIDDHSQNLLLKIDGEFDAIFNKLKQRKQSLYKLVEEWKVNKLEAVNKEISDITRYQKQLILTKKHCKEIIKTDDNDQKNRENKINEITSKLLKQNEFEKYNDLLSFIDNNTKLMDIKFISNITTINKLDEYGQIMMNNSNSLCSVPSIKLNKAIKINELNNGYQIKILWEISNKQQNKNNISGDFMIKYIESMDDEKKDGHNDENDIEWKMMDWKQIKCFDHNNKYQVEIETILKFGKLYKYKISTECRYPINILIESNIISSQINYQGIPTGNIIKIPLKCYSHRKHDKDHDPSNILLTDDHKRYYSATNNDFHSGETDWIIFIIKDQKNLYFPTKFIIKNWEYSNGIDSMIIQIGDGHNKWFTFNSNKIFNIKKGSVYHNQYQEFSISGIGSSLIRNNKLKYIKIKFIKNHGNHHATNTRFIFYEFQLYGVELDHFA